MSMIRILDSRKTGHEGALTLMAEKDGVPVTLLVEEGTGDNLLREDREEGYVDYLNWYEGVLFDGNFVQTGDGGMILYREPIACKKKGLIDCLKDVINDASLQGNVAVF